MPTWCSGLRHHNKCLRYGDSVLALFASGGGWNSTANHVPWAARPRYGRLKISAVCSLTLLLILLARGRFVARERLEEKEKFHGGTG